MDSNCQNITFKFKYLVVVAEMTANGFEWPEQLKFRLYTIGSLLRKDDIKCQHAVTCKENFRMHAEAKLRTEEPSIFKWMLPPIDWLNIEYRWLSFHTKNVNY